MSSKNRWKLYHNWDENPLQTFSHSFIESILLLMLVLIFVMSFWWCPWLYFCLFRWRKFCENDWHVFRSTKHSRRRKTTAEANILSRKNFQRKKKEKLSEMWARNICIIECLSDWWERSINVTINNFLISATAVSTTIKLCIISAIFQLKYFANFVNNEQSAPCVGIFNVVVTDSFCAIP